MYVDARRPHFCVFVEDVGHGHWVSVRSIFKACAHQLVYTIIVIYHHSYKVILLLLTVMLFIAFVFNLNNVCLILWLPKKM